MERFISCQSIGEFEMAINNVRTSVEMPQFNRRNIRAYMKELKMWQSVCGVEKKKQGLVVWLSLSIDDPSNIKEAIHGIIGMDDLIKEDGLDKIIDLLEMMSRQQEMEYDEEEEDKDELSEVKVGIWDMEEEFCDDEGFEQDSAGKVEALEKERIDMYAELRQEEVEDDEEEQGDEGRIKMHRMETKIGVLEQELVSIRSGQEKDLSVENNEKVKDLIDKE